MFFLLFSTFTFFQTYDITGIVLSEKNIPLESSNIIAKPLEVKVSLKFAITDNKGRFRLELDKNIKYKIIASYIGFIFSSFPFLELNTELVYCSAKILRPGNDFLKY